MASVVPPHPFAGRHRPMVGISPHLLTGIRVLDITDENGVYATRLLADLGASVVRIVPPRGDPLRAMPPLDSKSGVGFFYEFMNLHKRSVFLDINDPESLSVLEASSRWADIVFVSLAGIFPGTRLAPESLVPVDEARVWVTLEPFGKGDSRSAWLMDDLLYQAAGGLLTLSGTPEREPLRLFGRQTAYMAGIHAAGAALIGYIDAHRRNRLRTIDLSIQAAIMHTLETAIQFYTTCGEVRSRRGRSAQAGDGTFRAKDGLVALACITETTWAQLLSWLRDEGVQGVDELAEWDLPYRRGPVAIETFRTVFEAFSSRCSQQKLYRRAQAFGVVLSPVNRIADLFTDPQLLFERWFTNLPLAEWGLIPFPGPPYRIGSASISASSMAPTPGADSDSFTTELRLQAQVGSRVGAGRQPQARRPLEGIRLLEFTFGGAAPLAAKLMADFGADVVKVESSSRVDFPRITPPFADGIYGVNRSAYFTNRNSSKRSVELDLHNSADLGVALELASAADVVLNNFRAGVLERLGLGYQEIVRQNPNVIFVSMPMVSGAGPNSGFRGFGRNVSALSGIHWLTGYSTKDVIGPGTHFPDHAANPGHALVVILAALISSRVNQGGCYIEVAQVTSTLQLIGPYLLQFAATGNEAMPEGNVDAQACPYGVFRCSSHDDAWIAIAVRTDEQWNALLRAASHSTLSNFRNLESLAERKRHQTMISSALVEWLRGQESPQQAAVYLQNAGVPAAPVQSARDLVDEESMSKQAWLLTLDHPEMGHVTYNLPPFRFADFSEPKLRRAPCLGEHSDEVIHDWLNTARKE